MNILSERQADLARHFARAGSDKFEGVAVRYGRSGAPLIEGSLAHIECQVLEAFPGGTHSVFVAVVQTAERFNGAPLAYFRGRYARLEIDPDTTASSPPVPSS